METDTTDQIILSAPAKTSTRKSKNNSKLKVLKHNDNKQGTKRKRKCRKCGLSGHRADNAQCPAKSNRTETTAMIPSAGVETSATNEPTCRICGQEEKSGRVCSVCKAPVHHLCSNVFLGEQADLLSMSGALCSDECKKTYF